MSDEQPLTKRQIARQEQRETAALATDLANTLMKLPESMIRRLGLEDEVRDAVNRARKITANGARRRAERELAGNLRAADMAIVAQRLAAVQATGTTPPPKSKSRK
jgi:ribosomal 50S subunit-associated protein YjgA (DUF615 family)